MDKEMQWANPTWIFMSSCPFQLAELSLAVGFLHLCKFLTRPKVAITHASNTHVNVIDFRNVGSNGTHVAYKPGYPNLKIPFTTRS